MGKPTLDFPGGSVVKNPGTHAGNMGSVPELGRSPGDKHGNIYLPGKSHWQMRLVGCSPWGCNRVRHNLATKNNKNNNPTLCLWDESNWTWCVISFVYVTRFNFLVFFFCLLKFVCFILRGEVSMRDGELAFCFLMSLMSLMESKVMPHGTIERCSYFHFRKSLWKLCFNSLLNVCWNLPTFKEGNKTYY